MAERAPDPIKIPSSGETTPEYNAVRKSYGEIEPAIIPDDFVSQAHSCGLLPTRNPSSPPLEVVLNEISRDPVNYYCLQHVVIGLNVENRFDKGIGKMGKTFQCKDLKHQAKTILVLGRAQIFPLFPECTTYSCIISHCRFIKILMKF